MGNLLTFPAPIYIALSDWGPDGWGGADPVDTLDDAADQASEAERLTGRDARVLRIDLDAGTAVDVTHECTALCMARLAARGWAAE